MYQDQINAYFADKEQQFLDIASKLIAIPSPRGETQPGFPYGKAPAEALAAALDILKEMGFSPKNMENHVGIADLNDKETMMAILCHLDVVPEGTGWQTPAYRPVVKNGHLYGRGSSDNKGPAAAAMLAMQAVKEMNIPLKYNTRLILGTAEETGSQDITYYRQHEKTPPYTFSPDGEFPVTNTEKGNFRPTFSQTWAEAKTLPHIISIKGGHTFNIIPEHAEAVVKGMTALDVLPYLGQVQAHTGAEFAVSEDGDTLCIAAHGKPEHASTPEKGINAVTALLALLSDMPFADHESFKAVKALNRLFPHGDYYGKAAGIAQADEVSGPLTLSFNILEFTPTGFSGRFDSRVPLCANKENCQDVMEKHFHEAGIQVESRMIPGHHTPCDSPFVGTLNRVYEQYTGYKGGCESTGGGTYVHSIDGGVCFGAMMPGAEPNMHGANEHVSISEMLTAAKIFTQVIVDICG